MGSLTKCDILVVGGGPAGLSCAEEVAPSYSTVVVEEHPEIGEPTHCTGVLGLKSLQELGIGYRNSALSYIKKARLHSPSHSKEFSFPNPVAVVVDRSKFDKDMARRAEGRGAHILTSTRALKFKGRWNVEVERKGRREEIEARALVAADGFQSGVAYSLGMREAWPPDNILSCYQMELEGKPETTEVYFSPWAKNFFAWRVPLQDTTRMGLCTRNSSLSAKSSLRKFSEEKAPGGKILKEGGDVIPLGPIKKTYAHGALVVGEAAGLIKPLTGGGVIYGITSGRIAGEVLKGAEDFSESSLSQYEEKWKGSLKREIDFGMLFSRLFYSLSQEERDRLFQALDRRAIEELKAGFDFDRHTFLLKFLLRQGYRTLRALGPKRSAGLLRELRNF